MIVSNGMMFVVLTQGSRYLDTMRTINLMQMAFNFAFSLLLWMYFRMACQKFSKELADNRIANDTEIQNIENQILE